MKHLTKLKIWGCLFRRGLNPLRKHYLLPPASCLLPPSIEELQQSDRSQHAIAFSSDCQCTLANLDVKLLRQILSNLFSNCLKCSPIGSTVKFSVITANDRAIFQTQDSGIGIPPNDIKHIFEPFHRASNVSNMPGMGLGMSIVKQAIDLHGGEIFVESAIVTGTIFTVTLPFSRNLNI